ncbi:hypothetical protein ALP72_200023 [Pseudomonas coronafaciens pv. coronafaciens]|nr:hypothetical protein ALQ71_200244 [Pseudomonas coronafaciens pv. striafaciens]RMS09972.1 hypothetical protein ALP72_200023 [Pseudomonas coronafaciens pv. coronafaciens]
MRGPGSNGTGKSVNGRFRKRILKYTKLMLDWACVYLAFTTHS